jgi:hypothetical protein
MGGGASPRFRRNTKLPPLNREAGTQGHKDAHMAAVWLHSALKEASERATRVMAYALEKLGGLPPPAGKSYHDESPRWTCWHTLLALKEADNAVALQGVKALYIKLTTSTDRDDIKQQVLFDCTTAVLTRLAVERGGDYALLAQDAQVVMAEGSEPTWAALLDCFMDKPQVPTHQMTRIIALAQAHADEARRQREARREGVEGGGEEGDEELGAGAAAARLKAGRRAQSAGPSRRRARDAAAEAKAGAETALLLRLASELGTGSKNLDKAVLKNIQESRAARLAAGLTPAEGSPVATMATTLAYATMDMMNNAWGGDQAPPGTTLAVTRESLPLAAQALYAQGTSLGVFAVSPTMVAGTGELPGALRASLGEVFMVENPQNILFTVDLAGSVLQHAVLEWLQAQSVTLFLSPGDFAKNSKLVALFGGEQGAGQTLATVLLRAVGETEDKVRRHHQLAIVPTQGYNAILAERVLEHVVRAVNGVHKYQRGGRGPAGPFGPKPAPASAAPYGYCLYVAMQALGGGVGIVGYNLRMADAISNGTFLVRAEGAAAAPAAREHPAAADAPSEGGAAAGAGGGGGKKAKPAPKGKEPKDKEVMRLESMLASSKDLIARLKKQVQGLPKKSKRHEEGRGGDEEDAEDAPPHKKANKGPYRAKWAALDDDGGLKEGETYSYKQHGCFCCGRKDCKFCGKCGTLKWQQVKFGGELCMDGKTREEIETKFEEWRQGGDS